jgi:hypothetical protein
MPWSTALASMSLVGQTSRAGAPRFSLLPLQSASLTLLHPGACFVRIAMEGSSRLIQRVGDAGRLRHGFCLTARKTETARITRQSRDEQSFAMRMSVVLWCKGSELRPVQRTQFYAVVDAADNMPVRWCHCTNTKRYSLRTIPFQVQVQVATGNKTFH